MISDFVQISLAFLEGFGLIISPCILPILPLILSGSLESGKKRPYGIILGFIVTFVLFTFFSKSLVSLTGINLTVLRIISYSLLLVFACIMLSTFLTDQFTVLTNALTRIGSGSKVFQGHGFWSGILFGVLVGVIWTPCAGPILAVVLVQAVLQKTTLHSFFILLSFSIGAAIPMLLIALFGRKIMNSFQIFKNHAYFFRKLLGIIIIASVIYMIYGENIIAAAATETAKTEITALQNGIPNPYPAPPLQGITAWINSAPLQLSMLKGKVILIDFWAYSCINCIRTLPYLKTWYQRYHQKGLTIIGVHAPEFEFEHSLENVKNAVKKQGLLYPVALDNNFVTWQLYNNRYWPAHYLIDQNGNVVYVHFGEGDYEITENNIRYLLGIKSNIITEKEVSKALRLTPETYLGYARADHFVSLESLKQNQIALYSFPNELSLNEWALKGLWKITAENIVSESEQATLKIHFYAKKVFIVMGSSNHQLIHVTLLYSHQGQNVMHSSIAVKEHRLYEALTLQHPEDGILEMIPDRAGLEVYTFTFGE